MASVIETDYLESNNPQHSLAEPAVEVRCTAIGSGVFALRKFRRGEVIDEIRGEVIDDPEYGSAYCMDLGESLSLDPDPPYRFLNHSCDPNAELFQYVDEDGVSEPRMWLHALRKIRPAEQITIDYSWPAEAAISCLCQSPKCRGWIVDRTELKLLKRLHKKQKKSKRKKEKR